MAIKYGFKPASGMTAASVTQVSDRGYGLRIAYFQPGARLGSYSELDYEAKWYGPLFRTEAEAIKALAIWGGGRIGPSERVDF